jgi:tagaturonate epimerase
LGAKLSTLTIKNELLNKSKDINVLVKKKLYDSKQIEIYSKSIFDRNGILFFIAKENSNKYLYLLCDEKSDETIAASFNGKQFKAEGIQCSFIKKCELNTDNRKSLQQQFEFTLPKLIGLENSFGFGDRIGLANPAHIRSLENSTFKPILAQQSIRELSRTNRVPAEVMDAAVWAVFQEGYTNGFGADADHLKSTEDIDLMVKNGFKMFTFDPGEYVNNEADTLNDLNLDEAILKINWAGLLTNFNKLQENFANSKFNISKELQIEPSITDIKRAVLKYGRALAHIKKMYDHLKLNYPDYESEVEVSVDETESVTSPFEHFFIVKELNRLGVQIISLAPRFVGSFEKGIDYKGNLNVFKKEYLKHLQIAEYFGKYKISLHSGSDKFSVYKVIGEINSAVTHIKTAGTSYLEALKVSAIKQPELFREILDYSSALYENEKKSYHVSADTTKLKSAKEYSDRELLELFDNNDCRQVLHVTFGRILTDINENGEFIFKHKLIECLINNEETHYEIIIKHFKKHLDPFN